MMMYKAELPRTPLGLQAEVAPCSPTAHCATERSGQGPRVAGRTASRGELRVRTTRLLPDT
jgi:hypothetical protein